MRCYKSFTQANTIFATLGNRCFNCPLRSSFAEYEMAKKKGMLFRGSAYPLKSGACFVQTLDMPLA